MRDVLGDEKQSRRCCAREGDAGGSSKLGRDTVGMMKEFQEFAFKGNLIDMAVGIIMGAAFGPIIASLVGDIIMPPIGALMSGADFSTLKAVIPGTEVGIGYGKFINAIINFLITAFAIFMLVKLVNAAKSRMEAEKAAAPPPAPARQEVLLEEIRDALRKR
jgi:large conductance mechanosensitive channel